MSNNIAEPNAGDDDVENLRGRAEQLEQKLRDLERDSSRRLIRAELKAEALKVGILDLEGLKLLDLSSATLNDNNEVDGASQIMAQFKKAKPWLFGTMSSSGPATAPAAQPLRQKMATEMTDSEYRAARAALLKHHS